MGYFENTDFFITDDKSVGLFNKGLNEIYHSRQGALTESLTKFIYPISQSGIDIISNINVLDICYGIGYNSKAFLYKYSDEQKLINIDALEFEKIPVLISPLINDNINDDLLKLSLLEALKFEKDNFLIYKYLFENKIDFLSTFGRLYINFYLSEGYKYLSDNDYNSFLHNIYYNYISYSMNRPTNLNKYKNSKINIILADARKSIKTLNKSYDFVFLDAFSSKIDPTLWTIDFLSVIKSKMKNNSLLLSYSKSTPYRSALIELGFFVGKIISDPYEIGTVASLNKNLIVNPLNEYDFVIISSRSGIPYRDESLCNSLEFIINFRKKEINNSSRISRSQVDKKLKTKYY